MAKDKDSTSKYYSATPVPSADSFQGIAAQQGLLMKLAEFIRPSDSELSHDEFLKIVSARLLEKIGL